MSNVDLSDNNVGLSDNKSNIDQFFEFIPEDSRLTFTPTPASRSHYIDFYRAMVRSFWFAQEVKDMHIDRDHYQRLTPNERRPIDYILGFFSIGDKIINVNVRERFRKEIPIPEVEYVYDYIAMMENVHGEVYSLLLDNIITDTKQRQEILNSVSEMKVISKMIAYIKACVDSNEPLPKRLLRMACIEGVFFQGCFCIIYWFASRGLMPALTQSNSFIARDESDHTTFSLMLYSNVLTQHKLPKEEVYEIFDTALNVAKEFTNDALPAGLPDMNAAKMSTYLESIADKLLVMIKLPPLYGSKHSFSFLNLLNFPPSVNFFEKRTTEYLRGDKQNAEDNFDEFVDV
jgi:ribonucleoside-diphosphate reductase subunit M2